MTEWEDLWDEDDPSEGQPGTVGWMRDPDAVGDLQTRLAAAEARAEQAEAKIAKVRSFRNQARRAVQERQEKGMHGPHVDAADLDRALTVALGEAEP